MEETEWSGCQQQRVLKEFHSQARPRAETLECTKWSPTIEIVHAPWERRRCWDTWSVQDEDWGQVHLRIDRNSYLEVQDRPGSQWSRWTDQRRKKWSQQSRVLDGTPTSIVSHPGARTNLGTTGASFPIAIPILGDTWLSSKALSKAYKSEADDLRIWGWSSVTQSDYVPESSSCDVDNRSSSYKDQKSKLAEQQFRVLQRSCTWQCCKEESGHGRQCPERIGGCTKSGLIQIRGGRRAPEQV